MAGHAAYADECWRSSVMRLRNMSRQNEASIARHRALVERLSNINPDVRDARNRLLPDIETRRAAFRGDVEFRAKLAEERFTRIEASLADAVPFRDFGTREYDPDKAAEAAAAAAEEEEDRNAPLYRPRRTRRGGGRPRREEPEAPRGGILASLRREASDTAASSATHFSRTRALSVVARRREPDAAFHDGKARAAMARAQAHRAAFAAEEAARRRAREDAVRVAGDADALERGNGANGDENAFSAFSSVKDASLSSHAAEDEDDAEDRVSRLARLRATARARFRKVGLTVKMGLRAANALEDVSAEGLAAQRAEREASAAAADAAKAKHALDEATRSSTLAKRSLDAANEDLAEAEARAAEAGGVAARARDIADELRADGQLDAAALADKNVEAWQARARADETSAEGIREKRDGLLEAFEACEVRRLEAEETHAQKEAKARAARDAAETEDARAADSRAARAVVMRRVAREVLVRVRRAGDEGSAEEESSDADESSDGGESSDSDEEEKAREARKREPKDARPEPEPSKPSRAETRRVAMREAAAVAIDAGVRQDVAESLEEVRLASRAFADNAAAAALGAADAADAADRRLASRVSSLTSARAAADDARARFRDAAVALCEASAPGDSRETVFTLDADARVGRRLAAALGPASASPAFAKGVTPAFRLKPGLHVVIAVSERSLPRHSEPDGKAPRRKGAAPPTLAELLATAVPPAPREGDADDDEETRASAAADAGAAAAAAGNAFDAPPDASHFDGGPSFSPREDGEDRGDDENRDPVDGSKTRDRRGSVGAARRAARDATAESTSKWAKRAREKGLVPAVDPGTLPRETDGTAVTAPARPVDPRPAATEGAFNSVFRARAGRETRDPPRPAEKEKATATMTQTQLLGRFVRAQRACARAELIAARAFRERRDARVNARRLRDVANALALAVPAAAARRGAAERACAAGLAALAEGEAKYVEACLSHGPRRARIAKLERAEGAYAAAAAAATSEIDAFRADVRAKTRALAEARALSAAAADAHDAAKHAEARARAAAAAHEARWWRVLRQLRASSLGARPSVDPRASTLSVDDIDGEFAKERDALVAATSAASIKTRYAQFDREALAAPVAEARLAREAATRALGAALDARDDARQRHSAAAAVTSLDAEGDRLAEASSDAAARAAVEGGDERGMRRLALAAAAAAAAEMAERAERLASETNEMASGVFHARACEDAEARHAALLAAETELAHLSHDLARAREAECDAAAAMETARVGARLDQKHAAHDVGSFVATRALERAEEDTETLVRALARARAARDAAELASFEADDVVVEARKEARFNRARLAPDAARVAAALRAKAKALRPAAREVAEEGGARGDETQRKEPSLETGLKKNLFKEKQKNARGSGTRSALDAALAAAALAAADLASARETSERASRAVDAARAEKEASDRALADAARRQDSAFADASPPSSPAEETETRFTVAAAFYVEATRRAAEAEATASTLRASGPGMESAVSAAEDASACAFAVVEETRRVLDRGSARAAAAREETERVGALAERAAKALASATAEKRAASETRRRASKALRDARAAVDAAREAEEEREARQAERADARAARRKLNRF
jgi:hypothetical protein